ncbi:MAG: hypothetical protein JNM94_11780 [Phycisphaerae bacterium]|nr:hypothetical protein [Phycisphaerae bacterium]
MHVSRVSTLAFVALASALTAACTTTPTSAPAQTLAVNRAYVTSPAPLTGEILCPITGEVVSTSSPNAWYGVFPVYCATVSDARQFTTLAKPQRAKLAAAQVLPQKRITNTTCPLTGEPLTAEAAPVLYEEVIIGFATVADANQFNSLAPAKKKKIIDEWRASEAAPATTP